MRLSIVTHDHPWPATHGGRVDMWSRLNELKRRGCSLQLFSWGTWTPTAEEKADMLAVCEEVHFFIPRRGVRSFINPRFPGTVYNRMWNSSELKEVVGQVERFRADIVLADGSMVGGAARQILHSLNQPVPFFIRSHNVEFEYCRLRGRSEPRAWVRLAYALETQRYFWFERWILKQADHVFQSAYDDFMYWKSAGYANQSWMPPILWSLQPKALLAAKAFDVVYLGNLGSKHKLSSVLWFIEKVRLLLPPDLRIAIGGADAPADFAASCRAHQCTYVGEVKSADEFLAQGKVLINPVREACGLNVKIVEMLQANVPVVSTSAGLRGYPDNIRRLVHVANAAGDFAREIQHALSAPERDAPNTELLERTFGPQALDPFVAKANELIAASARPLA